MKTSRVPIPESVQKKALEDSLDSIQLNIESYRKGVRAGWLCVSTQLYILLVDPNPTRSLLGRLLPDISFIPLASPVSRPKDKDDVEWLMHSPGPVHFESGKLSVKMYDDSKPKIPMKKWLKQVIGVHSYKDKGHYTTIRDLIRYSRIQMGAGHFDIEWDEISKSLENPRIVSGGVDYPFYEWAIVVTGSVVANEVNEMLGCLTTPS